MKKCLGLLVSCSASALFLAAISAPARGALPEWLAAVAAGTPAGYTSTNIASPVNADIGTYDEAGGVSYEFIVNASNDGVSSALMGTAAVPAVADRAGFKWEQWQDTTHYGTTEFGVADFDSGVVNTPGVNAHLVFVNNGTDTALWVNGALAATIAGSTPLLSGTVGIGQVYNGAGAPFDPLVGTILGVAVYDLALTGSEIGEHSRAFAAVPEPASVGLALACFAFLRAGTRRR